MEATYDLAVIIASILPLFSGATLVLVMLFSLQNCVTGFEFHVKQTLLCFIALASLRWLAGFMYIDQLQLCGYIGSLAVVIALFANIFYYKFIRFIVDGKNVSLSKWHYIIPSIIFIAEIIQRAFISHYMLPERLIELLYAIFYLLLSVRMLIHYYRTTQNRKSVSKNPLLWTILLATSPLLSTIMYLLSLISDSTNRFFSSIFITLILLIVWINAQVAYAVLSRQFLFYVPSTNGKKTKKLADEEIAEPITSIKNPKQRNSEVTTDDSGRQIVVKLTEKRFEEYMSINKPYLNPQLKITDLVEPLKANRTFISNFVNKTYGFNFNQYINTMRLRELERISDLPANVNIKHSDLIQKAGFATMRNYTRALSAINNKNED